MAPKKQRSRESCFTAEQYKEAIEHAMDPNTRDELDWSGKSYRKNSRAQGPDFEGLVNYKLLVSVLLRRLAPNGLPNLACLKAGLTLCVQCGLVKKTSPKSLDSWLTDAVDKQKLMCAHIRALKIKGGVACHPDVQTLISLVKLESHVKQATQCIEAEASACVHAGQSSASCEVRVTLPVRQYGFKDSPLSEEDGKGACSGEAVFQAQQQDLFAWFVRFMCVMCPSARSHQPPP